MTIVVVKNLDDLEYTFEGKFYTFKQAYNISNDRFKTYCQDDMCTPLYFSSAENKKDCFRFELNKNSLTIRHNFDNKFVAYTDVYHIHHVDKIEYDADNKEFKVADSIKIRFLYYGPDELALQWKLSI